MTKLLLIIVIAFVAMSCTRQEATKSVVPGINELFECGDTLVVIDGKANPDSLSIEVGIVISKTSIDSSQIRFNRWCYLHDKFMDMNDSTWKYMYVDLDKAEFYMDSMKYYFNERK